jgi:deazaflavin-dependent oxidoreductase (nitroreductase family)
MVKIWTWSHIRFLKLEIHMPMIVPPPQSQSPTSAPLPPRPRGLVRIAVRLPILLYRLGLGWLLGHRFLLLTHRGRVSGQVRYTVLEVVHHDRAAHEYIVIAGFGPKSDWYQNLRTHPALEVRSRNERFIPVQRFLTAEEGDAVLAWNERHHPRALHTFSRVLRYPYDGTPAGRRAMATALPMVSFRRP